MFLEWWKDSFPSAKPATHTVSTHVAFAQHVLHSQTQLLLDQVRNGKES